MKKINTFIIVLLAMSSFAQEKLSLEECYSLVNKNYPIAKQTALFAKQHELDVAIIKTGKLPKLDFDAQATYQSDVIELPINLPDLTIVPPNKDQYKTTVSVNQLIYGGGLIDASVEAKSISLRTQQKQVEVSLYQLKEQVNQLYFSILLLQEKKLLLNAKKKQLETTLKEVKAGIKYGTIIPSSDAVLEAELLKIAQQYIEIEQGNFSLITTLSSLLGIEVLNDILLEKTNIQTDIKTSINRPELGLFQLQKEQIEASENLISKKNAPKLLGFATGGYGNPGLNMLDNSFQTYYMAGLKLNWSIFDWNANKKERKSLLINKEIIENHQEIFNLNTSIELNQQVAEMTKLTEFITSDKAIIELRKKVLKSTNSQLKNGVIMTSAYITELTNLYEAKNNLSTHKIQLQLAKASYKTTKGN